METTTKTHHASIEFKEGTFLFHITRDALMDETIKKMFVYAGANRKLDFAYVSGEIPGIGLTYGKKTSSIELAAKVVELLEEAGCKVLTSNGVQQKFQERFANREMSRAVESQTGFPINKAGSVPYPFQMAGIDFLAANKGTLLADQTGLGKTIQAIGNVVLNKDVKTILVICPRSVKINWAMEIKKWCWLKAKSLTKNPDPRFMQHTALGFTPRVDLVCTPKTNGSKMNGVWNIINHDRLRSAKTIAHIQQLKPDMIIVDECHAFINITAKRTQAFMKLEAPYRVAMSATPMNSIEQLYPVIKWLQPDMIPDRITFRNQYRDNAIQLGSDLRDQGILLRRTKRNCGMKFPGQLLIPNLLEPTPEVLAAYEGLRSGPVRTNQVRLLTEEEVREMAQWLEDAEGDDKAMQAAQDKINAKFESMLRSLRQDSEIPPTEIFKLKSAIEPEKIGPAVEKAHSLLQENDKIVILADLRYTVEEIAKKLDKFGVVAVNGGMGENERQTAVNRFTSSDEIRVFVGTTGSCKEGMNLQASPELIMTSVPWTVILFDQLLGRINRITSTETSTYHLICFDQTIDAMITSILIQKTSVFNMVMS